MAVQDVTLMLERHFVMTWNKPSQGNRSLTVRFGLFTLLLVRELSYYLVSQFTILMISFIVLRFPHNPIELARLLFFQYPVSAWFFIVRFVSTGIPS